MSRDASFLTYIPDVSLDTGHMNRLERGAYLDIMQAQQRLGRLPIEKIQGILGRDFEKCWPRVQLALNNVDGKYYISWLEKLILRKESYSKSRGDNATKKVKQKADEAKEMLKIFNDAPIQFWASKPLVVQMSEEWKNQISGYPASETDDFPALLDFAGFICAQAVIEFDPTDPRCIGTVMDKWKTMCLVVLDHPSWRKKSLQTLSRFNKQEIYTQVPEIGRVEGKRMIL